MVQQPEVIQEPVKPSKSKKSVKVAKEPVKAVAETKPELQEMEVTKASESTSIPESTKEPEPVAQTESAVDLESIAKVEVPKEEVAQDVVSNSDSTETKPVSDTVEDEKQQTGTLITLCN